MLTISGQTTALGDRATSMQRGTWAELTTNNIYCDVGAGRQRKGTIMSHTDTAVRDAVYRQFFFIAGDHDPRAVLSAFRGLHRKHEHLAGTAAARLVSMHSMQCDAPI